MRLFSTQTKGFEYSREELASRELNAGILPSVQGYQIALTDEQLADLGDLPEPRVQRTVSRSGLLMFTMFHEMKTALDTLAVDLRRVGIYGSAAKSGGKPAFLENYLRLGHGSLVELFMREVPPKQGFREGLNYPFAQLAIFLGTTGPLACFARWQHGVLHALERAEMDFAGGMIDAAFVIGAFALDNQIGSLAISRALPSETSLKEAAGVAFLTSAQEVRLLIDKLDSFDFLAPVGTCHYGNANAFIHLEARL